MPITDKNSVSKKGVKPAAICSDCNLIYSLVRAACKLDDATLGLKIHKSELRLQVHKAVLGNRGKRPVEIAKLFIKEF